jgi:hypothetical protein
MLSQVDVLSGQTPPLNSLHGCLIRSGALRYFHLPHFTCSALDFHRSFFRWDDLVAMWFRRFLDVPSKLVTALPPNIQLHLLAMTN